MRVFTYLKTFYFTDEEAKKLGLTYEIPYINLWQDDKNRWFITNDFLYLKNKIKYHDIFEAQMSKKGWKAVFKLPFIWEDNYRWHKIRKGVYQLTSYSTSKEDLTGEKQETIKTLPKRRHRKTKTIQTSSYTQPTQDWQNPDLIDFNK